MNKVIYEKGLDISYEKILRDYLRTGQKKDLYQIEKFSKELMKEGIGPEVIVEIHLKAIRKINKNKSTYSRKTIDESFTFLMEGIINYEIACQEYLASSEADYLVKIRDLNQKLSEKLAENYLGVVRALISALELKNSYTRGHSESVTRYAVALAKKLKLSPEEIESIEVAAVLHDIGKIGVQESILNKPGKLNDEEWGEMKQHPEFSYRILKEVNFPWDVKPIIYAHHERYDGKGYPAGLKGREIPLGARIIAVADTFAAMTSDRAYRKGLSKEAAIEELKRVAGAQLDPELVGVFVEILRSDKERL